MLVGPFLRIMRSSFLLQDEAACQLLPGSKNSNAEGVKWY